MAKSDWISVKDKLPEEIGYYMCWEGIYSSSTGKPEIGFFTGEIFETSIASDWTDVTHWQPLPPKPETE